MVAGKVGDACCGVNRTFTVLPGGVDGIALMRETAAGVISHFSDAGIGPVQQR